MSISAAPSIATRRKERDRQRLRAVAVALVCSGAVGLVEIVIGLVFRLHSVLFEGLHTLADMLDSVVVFWAVRRAAAPPDHDHQYGHGKYESAGAMIEGLVIALTGAWICYRALAALVRGEFQPELDILAISAMALASVFYVFVSRWLMRQWRQLRSPAVYAEAAHLRTHIFITAGLFGGLSAAKLGGWLWMDAVLALGVGVMLLRTAWRVLRPAWGQLTDAALAEEDVSGIRAILECFADEYIEIHGVRTRSAGVEWHLALHLVLRPDSTVQQAHELCDRIEAAVEAQYPDAMLTIHVEPEEHARQRAARADKVFLGRGS